ncbi:MAG: CoA-binding protein [Desulfurococcaceae archaeon]
MSPLDSIFRPSSVAIVGASPKPDKVGGVILENFVKRFRGEIYPVNPKYDEVRGLKAYPRVSAIPSAVDLVVIAIPAKGVPEVLEDAGRKGAKAAIIVSGGFSETGTEEGVKLERSIIEIARKYRVRVLGPNCLGVFDNYNGVDTFFLPDEKMRRPPKGGVSFISQSGAFASALLDWMALHGVGISKAISYGNKADIDDVELLEYLGEDETTKVIVIYVEGLKPGSGRRFVEAARKVIKRKPIVVYKAGKTPRGGVAARSHTAALAGEYSVYKAAFRQAGLVEAMSYDEIMDFVRVLSTQPLMKGRNVYIVTDAGGLGVMLTDALALEGLEVPRTPEDLRSRLRSALPQHCIVENPIDLTGDTDDERYMTVLEEVLQKDYVDAVAVVALPQVPGLRGKLYEYLVEAKERYRKPLVVISIGSERSQEISKFLESRGVPVFESPERAARALAALYAYSRIRLARDDRLGCQGHNK